MPYKKNICCTCCYMQHSIGKNIKTTSVKEKSFFNKQNKQEVGIFNL